MKSSNQTLGPEATINFDLLIVRPLGYKPQNPVFSLLQSPDSLGRSIRFRQLETREISEKLSRQENFENS